MAVNRSKFNKLKIGIRHYTNTGSFFSVLFAALIFSLSLPGVAAAQTNTTLGTGALQRTPRAPTTRLSDLMRSVTTRRAAPTPPSESMRYLVTPRAAPTPPVGSMRSLATPRAAPTLPSESVRSLVTPRATTTPPSGPWPMCLPGI